MARARSLSLSASASSNSFNGVLVDAAHVKMAAQTLARAALIKGSR
jgi:hypothetical protein